MSRLVQSHLAQTRHTVISMQVHMYIHVHSVPTFHMPDSSVHIYSICTVQDKIHAGLYVYTCICILYIRCARWTLSAQL